MDVLVQVDGGFAGDNLGDSGALIRLDHDTLGWMDKQALE